MSKFQEKSNMLFFRLSLLHFFHMESCAIFTPFSSHMRIVNLIYCWQHCLSHLSTMLAYGAHAWLPPENWRCVSLSEFYEAGLIVEVGLNEVGSSVAALWWRHCC